MKKTTLTKVQRYTRSPLFIILAIVLAVAGIFPALVSRSASAAQITTRQLKISSGVPSASSVTYTFGASTGGSDPTNGFFFGTSHIVKGMKYLACTTAVGTCSAPAGIDLKTSTGGFTLTGWQDATAFTKDTTNQNDCDGTQTNILCISRSGATVAENTTNSHKIVVTGVVNPSTANVSFFIRMTSYTNATYTAGSITDTGTVASAVVQTLTVNAAVAEILNFCVGSTGVDDAITSVAGDCTGVSGTSVNLGTLDTGKISITPETTNCTPADCTKNGVAMLRTNAANGATVSYDSIQQSGTRHLGTLRIAGQTCSTDSDNNSSDVTANTDACFNVRTAQAAFDTTNERFGMTVGYVNCGSTTSYTCTYSSGTYNLARDAAYDCTGANTVGLTDLDQINGPTQCGYAWDEAGTMTQVASSTSSTTKQVDDEALIMKFAAHPRLTTPFGAYTAQMDMVAVTTY